MATSNTQPFNNGDVSLPPLASNQTFSAGDYILCLFKPADPICVMLLRDGEPSHEFMSAQEAASSKYQAKLHQKNKRAGISTFA